MSRVHRQPRDIMKFCCEHFVYSLVTFHEVTVNLCDDQRDLDACPEQANLANGSNIL